MSPHKQREVDLLVTGGLVVTLDDEWTVTEDGAVAIEGGTIVSVGPSTTVQADYAASENIDATGHIVMPGLVNAHTHAATSLFRGFADDRPLQEWLEQYIWPAEQEFVNPDTVRWGTLLAIAEMLRTGVTLFLDMYFHEEVVAGMIPRSKKNLFPTIGVEFDLLEGKTTFKGRMDGQYRLRLVEWFRRHRNLKPGDEVTFSRQNGSMRISLSRSFSRPEKETFTWALEVIEAIRDGEIDGIIRINKKGFCVRIGEYVKETQVMLGTQ